MSDKLQDVPDDAFLERRSKAIDRINRIGAELATENPDRGDFFETVYDDAAGDAAMVPWADLAPKPNLVEWLQNQPVKQGRAIDVGCGLGDNAEALCQRWL